MNNIIDDLNKYGFASSRVELLFNKKELCFFKSIKKFYVDALLDSEINSRIREIENGKFVKNGIYKGYEITHNEYLKSPLTLTNLPLIQMYTSDNILKIAKEYLGENIKLRNPLAWIHPSSNNKKEIRSQKWHRDQEDFKMLKVFILFSDVKENNGPTHYVKSTNASGKHKNIAPNMTWLDGHWSNKNKTVKKFYNFIREKIPYNYPIPKHNIVKATGDVGTIFFIDTNGLHKGGNVTKGIRLMTHCNFLRETAPMLNKGMPLEKLNSDEKLFSFDYNSKTFKSFDSNIQKMLI